MRIASWSRDGRRYVGTISPDGREATPLVVPGPDRGAFELIRSLAHGDALPAAAAASCPV